MIKKINYFLQAVIIYLFFIIARIIGLKISRKFFSFLFCSIGPSFKSKNVVKNNIKTFSQNISNIERDIIINKMWKNYGMTFIEYIFLDYFQKNTNLVEIDGQENLPNQDKDDKPVIFISGHFANFELMSMEITKKNIDLATIYRPLNNFFLNPLMEY